MARLQQGSVAWATIAPPFGRRPVVVLTRDGIIGRANNITVGPITRTIRALETEVVLEPSDNVPSTCAVTLDNILTVQRLVLGDVITVLSREKLLQIFAAIRRAFDMPPE